MSEHCMGCLWKGVSTATAVDCPGIAVAQSTVDVAGWLEARCPLLKSGPPCCRKDELISADFYCYTCMLAEEWSRSHTASELPPSGEPARQTAQDSEQTALPPSGDSAPPSGDRGLDSATSRTVAPDADLMAAVREANLAGEQVTLIYYSNGTFAIRMFSGVDTTTSREFSDTSEAARWLREVVEGKRG